MDTQEMTFIKMLDKINNLCSSGDLNKTSSLVDSDVVYAKYVGEIPFVGHDIALDEYGDYPSTSCEYIVESFRGKETIIHYNVEGVAHGTLYR